MGSSGLHDGEIATAVQGTLNALLAGSNAKILVRSNMSPDITVNLSDLLKPSSEGAPKAISSSDEYKLQWIKPEIELRALGATTAVYAPYGNPSREAFLYFAIALVVASLLGARVAWGMCRSLGKR